MTRKAKVWALFVLLFVLNIFDYLATDIILILGGIEANPLQARMIASYGPIGIMYLKTPFLVALGLMLLLWDRYTVSAKRSMEIGLTVCTVIYSALAVWHCALLTLLTYRA